MLEGLFACNVQGKFGKTSHQKVSAGHKAILRALAVFNQMMFLEANDVKRSTSSVSSIDHVSFSEMLVFLFR